LADETLLRRSGFRDGTPVRLADGRLWTIPGPPKPSEWKKNQNTPFGPAYSGLLCTIEQAERLEDRRLAEHSLAIFLLGFNYSVTSADYEELLGFAPGSAALTEWQSTIERITQEHLESLCYARSSPRDEDDGSIPIPPGWFFRLLAWFRDQFRPRR
jgi:hypothetical protein